MMFFEKTSLGMRAGDWSLNNRLRLPRGVYQSSLRGGTQFRRGNLNLRMKGVEPQLVYSGIFPPALRQNPREYDSIHSGFFLIRQKSTRYKLLRTENEIIFMDFSVQRRSNPWRVAIDDKPIKTQNDSLSAIEFNSLHPNNTRPSQWQFWKKRGRCALSTACRKSTTNRSSTSLLLPLTREVPSN